ncbi:hypothetical protein BE17_04205 [Sorangium cellulosum]|uniref:Uncharacterized protein n=1 Tax=Sorangium cellulosum TaxID=56 RepID=A0A150RLE4_SORCE|nr:hypothetical protein BE17_04205 [Sorangium cellulosum]
MNPGVFIMGGGGNGGGGNGRGGNGSGDGQGSGGKNGDNGARGGGKDAGSCGPGSGGGCPNPTHGGGGGTHAGDPVDPISGRAYTVATVDLALPGTIPLVIKRSYSSALLDQDCGLGFGWTHSLAWHIEERRRGLRVLEPHAARTELPKGIAPGESARLPCGVLTRYPWGYTLAANGLARVFAEQHGSCWFLSQILDANDNRIELFYEAGRLVQILDSVGRIVRVRRLHDGHIAAFEVKNAAAQGRWEARRRYTVDARGDLVQAIDAEGHAHQFAYDEEHRLVRREEPGGLVVEFRYGDAGRCVETWCHRDGNDALDQDVPSTLDDGSPVKGFLHVKIDHQDVLTEMITSRSKRRVEGNPFDKLDRMAWLGGVHTCRYDEAGELIEYADALNHVWRSERDPAGRLLAHTDPLGNRTQYDVDERGLVAAMTDALGGTARYERDARGNVLVVHDDMGFVVSFAYDARGLLVGARLPNGGETRMEYDGLANRILVVEPDGSERRIRYDFLGRVQGFVDERGHETRYAHDACGRLRAVYGPRGAVTRYDYDVDGNPSRLADADGRATTLRWGGFHVVTEIVRPDGSVVRYRYDREQDLVRVINEIGEEHRLLRDGEGRVVQERTFDGREIRYRLDVQGRITRMQCGPGSVDFDYDPLGRLVKRSTSDGREDLFEWDALGRLERAVSADVECEFSYDRRGRVVRESTRQSGRVLADFVWTYDAMGKVLAVRGPGGEMSVQRDVMGRPITAQLATATEPVRFAYDAGGHEVERLLPGGGRVVTEVDAEGLLARQSVVGSPRRPVLRPGEPPWVGPLPADETWRRTYPRSAAGLVQAEEDLRGGRRELRRDVNGRVVERSDAGKVPERLSFSASGDLYTAADRRTYAPGGRLAVRVAGQQEARYVYTERGDVREKRVRGPEGERVWTFDWSDDGRLLETRLPDGKQVAFAYDAFGRRIEKRVTRAGRVESVARYAWRGDVMVRELRERAQDTGDPIVEERTYLVLPESVLPLAQRDGAAGALRYFVHGTTGFPEALVQEDGRFVAEVESALYGDISADQAGLTPLRLPGQYADEETGLFCNWHRYYDPETGVYLSPEPIGLEGGLKPYAYADSWLPDAIDPDGLKKDAVVTTIRRKNGTTVTGTSQERTPGDLHKAVLAALPPMPARDPDDPTAPWNCAEPAALSAHLRDWEERNSPKKCEPGAKGWKKNLRAAMREIDEEDGISSKHEKSGVARAACPNCSQTIPRLFALAGMMPPTKVLAPGYQNRKGLGPVERFSEPNDGFHGSPNNKRPNTSVAGTDNLGTWSLTSKGWRRHS